MLSTLIDKIRTEPAVVVGTVASVLLLFGIRVSQPAVNVATQILTAAGPVLAGLVIRRHVTPTARTTGRTAP